MLFFALSAIAGFAYAAIAAFGDPYRSQSAFLSGLAGALMAAALALIVRYGWTGEAHEAIPLAMTSTLDDIMRNLGFFGLFIVLPVGLAFIFAGLVLFPALVLVPLGAAIAFFLTLANFVRGCHYLFVPHPAEPIIRPALRQGTSIDTAALADVVEPVIKHLHHPPPVYQSENQAARARALKDKIDADTELAEAALRRERAAAELRDAERRLAEAKRKASRG